MTDIAHDVGHHSEHESLGVDNRKLAMWVFLASEFMFFGALISTYLLFKGKEGMAGPLPRELYDIPFTSVSSFVLLMSSLTMVLAHNALTRKDQPATRSWLLATALLGMVFIAFSLSGEIGILAGLAVAVHHLVVKSGFFALASRWGGSVDALSGLGRRSPLAGAIYVLFALSLIGVPPLPLSSFVLSPSTTPQVSSAPSLMSTRAHVALGR